MYSKKEFCVDGDEIARTLTEGN